MTNNELKHQISNLNKSDVLRFEHRGDKGLVAVLKDDIAIQAHFDSMRERTVFTNDLLKKWEENDANSGYDHP